MADGPTFTRRQLGKQLRLLRQQSTKNADSVEDADIMSTSKLYKIEAGKQPKPSWPEIQELARWWGADETHVRELVRMATDCLRSGWYVPFDIPLQFQSYVDLEGAATRLRFFEVEYVNGLFQTEGCMRAIQRSWGLATDEMEPHIEFRLQRARRFWSRGPAPEVLLVQSEAVLRRLSAESEIFAEQMERVRELAALPNVTVLVLPFAAGFHAAMNGAFTLLEFERAVYPEVAYVESRAECQYHERSAVIALYERIFSEMLELVVPIEEFEL